MANRHRVCRHGAERCTEEDVDRVTPLAPQAGRGVGGERRSLADASASRTGTWPARPTKVLTNRRQSGYTKRKNALDRTHRSDVIEELIHRFFDRLRLELFMTAVQQIEEVVAGIAE